MIQEFTKQSLRWLDVEQPSMEDLKELALRFKLPEHALKDCLQPDHLPKIEELEGFRFTIMRLYDLRCDKYASTIQQLSRKIAIFHNQEIIITIHRSEQSFLENLWLQTTAPDTHSFYLSIIQNVMNSFEVPLEEIEKRYAYIESRIFLKERTPDLLKTIYKNKRHAGLCRKVLDQTGIVLGQLRREHPADIVLLDIRENLQRLQTLYEVLLENLQNLMHLYLSLSSQRTNEVMRVLTVFSVFFMPLTFIVGVYGMNFDRMPELTWEWGYPATWGAMLLVTIVIFQWFKRKRWL